MPAINFNQPSNGTVESTSNALTVENTGTGGASGNAIVGESKGSGTGIFGKSLQGFGVYAESLGANYAIFAKSKSEQAVHAETNAPQTACIDAKNFATSGGIGIAGETKGSGEGVFGVSANGVGVRAKSQTGIGLYAESLGANYAIFAKSKSEQAVHAETTAPQTACIDAKNNTTSGGIGIYGETKGTGEGIMGVSNKGPGVRGVSSEDAGVHGWGPEYGVVGRCSLGAGVYGEGSGYDSCGVKGSNQDGLAGVLGVDHGDGIGVSGYSVRGVGVEARSRDYQGLYASSTTGYAGYFEGNIRVTGRINPTGGDLAEEFDANAQSEPGTVMVISNEGNLEPCCTSYDKRVAGIVSGAEGYKPGIVLNTLDDEQENRQHENQTNNTRLTVALTGKVYCKVDASLLPIEIGDMLTTSSTNGHAMKVNEPTKAFGAVIGKALQPLRNGVGIIPVLVGLF